MIFEFVEKLKFSNSKEGSFGYPLPLIESIRIISEYFKLNRNNKLCIVFPSKEYAAQWITIYLTLSQILLDYIHNYQDIYNSHLRYKKGDRLILNNEAIVEWVKSEGDMIYFRYRPYQGIDEIGIKLKHISKLQRAPANRKSLSSFKRVMKAYSLENNIPIDKLLNINTQGNREFQKNSVCLISKYKSYDDSLKNVYLNNYEISDYFKYGRINEEGVPDIQSPLLISNNFSNLNMLLSHSKPASKIIIDGFESVTPRNDFSDIDREHMIATILISDLSEIEAFEDIRSYDFDFFNLTDKMFLINEKINKSPFVVLENKFKQYSCFKLKREICHNPNLDNIFKNLHSLPIDHSDQYYNKIKTDLIQLTNQVSRICYLPDNTEFNNINSKLENIKTQFTSSQLWLGEANDIIEDTILSYERFIGELAEYKTDKCKNMEGLLNQDYDYIICPTIEEANTLKLHLQMVKPKIISIADVNNIAVSEGNVKGILTGWPKSEKLNNLISKFIFSELVALFYMYENKYYISLNQRNNKCYENIKPTIEEYGIIPKHQEEEKPEGFRQLFFDNQVNDISRESVIDIIGFEQKLEDMQYSKYYGKGNIYDSIKAKRIEFENDTFIYATETHKFLVINELFNSNKSEPNIQMNKYESLNIGDTIAFINTERDVLIEIVEKMVDPEELFKVKRWTELWKTLLRNYFETIDYDFKKLLKAMRGYGCNRHDATIRAWLQDDSRIGPESDSDLRSIAFLTKSSELKDNIPIVREAIRQMTGWRMRAADFVRGKIRSKLMEIMSKSKNSESIEIPDLGKIEVLKISEMKREPKEIDKRYVNRLLLKDFN